MFVKTEKGKNRPQRGRIF